MFKMKQFFFFLPILLLRPCISTAKSWNVALISDAFSLSIIFQFTLACIKMGRIELAQKAVALAEKRLPVDSWPEYYDTRTGKFIGKQARMYQTWTIAGFLTSKMLLKNPEMASMLFWEEDYELLDICVCGLSKSGRKRCSRGAARSQILVWRIPRVVYIHSQGDHIFILCVW